jgi:hypothetical protein
LIGDAGSNLPKASDLPGMTRKAREEKRNSAGYKPAQTFSSTLGFAVMPGSCEALGTTEPASPGPKSDLLLQAEFPALTLSLTLFYWGLWE